MSTTEEKALEYLARVEELQEQVTILKAERDEATREAERWWQRLLNVLARIHRDGGHYTEQHGIEKSLEDADSIIAKLLVSEVS